MDTAQFLQSVELLAGLNRDSARRAAQATLATLAERVGRPVATELAGGLPDELGAALTGGPDAAEPFDAEEFARRTAAREDVDPAQATLREDVAGVQELRDRLPADYRPLFG
jgi:uncharacterized protein (DUF2267 family)